jgi:hypothetical protein
VEFQSKTPAGGFGRECAVTRGLCSITDKSAIFWLPTTNTSPVGQKFVMIRAIPDSRENAQASAAQRDREAIARGHWSMIRKKTCPGLIRSGNRFFEKIILKHNVREG